MNHNDTIQLRLAPELKQAFMDECRAQYRTPSDVLRELMRDWLYKNTDGELAKQWKRRTGAKND